MNLIEIIENERKEYDFRYTYVFKILDTSEKLKRKFSSPQQIWCEPEKFVEVYVNFIKESIASMDSDFWNLVFGYEGSGKSSFSLMIFSELLNRNLEKIMTNTIFSQTEYAKICYYFQQNNIKKEPILIDDAHYVFGKYSTLTKETLSILQLARFIRDQQIIHILNCQSPTQLYRDIWYERVFNYVYCFKVKKILNENESYYRMYAALWLDSVELKNNMDVVRNVSGWKDLLINFPPDLITRIDFLFPEYEKEYNEYKRIKSFYKEFYSYFRFKGILKASDFEKIMFLLFNYLNNQPLENSKSLQKFNLVDKKGYLIDANAKKLAEKHKDVIEKRIGLIKY